MNLAPKWKTLRVADLGRVVTGKTPPTGRTELLGDIYPFITPTDIGDNRDCKPARHLSEEGRASLRNLLLPAKTVCVTCIASVGKMCMTSSPSFTNQQINSVVVDEAKYEPSFVYYLLKTRVEHLKAIAGGAATPIINKSSFSEVEVSVPDLPTQRKIAGILSAYDDLIENNLRRIKILEQMAQSLYREWFVHFRFPGHEAVKMVDTTMGEIPEGWEVQKILDFADVIYGFSFKANRFNTAGEGIPVVRIRNIQDGQSETYTEEEGDPKHRIKNGDILVGMDGDFHMTIWSGGDAWQNQRVAKFRPKGAMGNYMLFLTLEKPIHYFDSTITGTTVAHLGDSHIKTIEFASPPEALMRKATDLLEPLAQEQLNLRRRNQTLRRTRDLLLPKLLSPN